MPILFILIKEILFFIARAIAEKLSRSSRGIPRAYRTKTLNRSVECKHAHPHETLFPPSIDGDLSEVDKSTASKGETRAR